MKKLLNVTGVISLLFLTNFCSVPESEETLTIDLSKSRETISPYIYGQFIEHLGRCIYGGIWSEMIEDRKFYYPVTDKYNPWGTQTDKNWNAGEFRILVASPWKTVSAPPSGQSPASGHSVQLPAGSSSAPPAPHSYPPCAAVSRHDNHPSAPLREARL